MTERQNSTSAASMECNFDRIASRLAWSSPAVAMYGTSKQMHEHRRAPTSNRTGGWLSVAGDSEVKWNRAR